MTNNRYKPISRRTILRISGVAWGLPATGGWAFAKSDFWNQKDSSEWSDTERNHILTNSPWARKATVALSGSGLSDGDPMGGGGGAMGGRGGGGSMGGGLGGGWGGGGGDMGGGRGGSPMGGVGRGMPKFDVTVRWESAAPIRDAVKETVPAEPDAYTIGVIGMPSMNMGQRRCTEGYGYSARWRRVKHSTARTRR
ncbi:MAG: hypothetical protein QOJ99_1068 [Bryobacterales bacterium]|jgi:hypothetical protein|nr:hypothetical protein [Bryobacterales bacterium]